MFPKIENWDKFRIRVQILCEFIIKVTSNVCKGFHLISVDEKTGIQAISRQVEGARIGKIEKRECEYTRHGTTTLIAGTDVASGKILHYHLGKTRNEQDFLFFCQKTVEQLPKADKKVFLLDQLNIHKSESLVKWVAEAISFKGELGVKGKKGILKNMVTRMEFLEISTHQIQFVFTPKHCSWLNPIENWFGKLQRHVLAKGVFFSVEELEQKIDLYIQYYNRCLFKPLNWKFKGFTKNTFFQQHDDT